jgi:hypothetical protein
LINKLIDEIDYPETKKSNIHDSICWVAAAWKEVSAQTIRNCFTHAGHNSSIIDAIESVAGASVVAEEEDDEEDSLPLGKLAELMKSRKQTANINIDELINFDDDIPTEEILNDETWEQELLDNYISEREEAVAAADAPNVPTPEEADEWMEEVEAASNKIPKSKQEIREYLNEIEFFLAEKYPLIIPDFVQLRSAYLDVSNKETKQSSILNYFKPI